ncbi:phosphoglycerate mutase family protein [Pigmentibacter sp. JX0631]|uniref:histidine phosphatase family protein n=1 Tax=Pigmentibacter sp. JX0631 TaxID=2976982 RepID=UPI00246832B4|nr:histidine phosphatase family protein [Pigmentibacter sp. JX0631]WGL59903.1 phosphoglycerate mutase family protein [Pigmentibacter sp. JX0631]
MKKINPLVILFRHGQTDYNAEKRFQGQQNCPLNMNGLEQVQKTGDTISELLTDIFMKFPNSKIIECRTSDLQRSFLSAKVVSKVISTRLGENLNFICDPNLREYHAGDLENYTIDEYLGKNPGKLEKYFSDYKDDPLNAKYPGENSESWNMVSKRILPYLLELNNFFSNQVNENPQIDLMQDGTSQDIFIWSTHGGVIRNFLSLMQVCDFKTSYIEVGNGDVLLLKPAQLLQTQGSTNKIEYSAANQNSCSVSWELLKHVKIGDSITVLTDISTHIK